MAKNSFAAEVSFKYVKTHLLNRALIILKVTGNIPFKELDFQKSCNKKKFTTECIFTNLRIAQGHSIWGFRSFQPSPSPLPPRNFQNQENFQKINYKYLSLCSFVCFKFSFEASDGPLACSVCAEELTWT